jgi:hypothetical protein
MFDLFTKEPALLIPIIAILSTGLVFLVWIMASYWHGARRLELEIALKKDMLTRGLSAGDIERILWASSTGPTEAGGKETISDNEYYLVEKMLDEEHPIEEIERVIRAFRGNTASIKGLISDRVMVP